MVKQIFGILLLFPMIVVKFLLTILGIIIVPVTFLFKRVPRLYQADSNRPQTLWEMIVRNPVNGLKWIIKHPAHFEELGYHVMEPTRQAHGFVWRYRYSDLFASIRLVWRYSDTRYGEMYLGWKLGSEPPDLDFATSLRPWAKVGQ